MNDNLADVWKRALGQKRTFTAVLTVGAILLSSVGSAWADPPPWAPAHGWRAQQGQGYMYYGEDRGGDYGKYKKYKRKKFKSRKYKGKYQQRQNYRPEAVYVPPIDLSSRRCDRQTLGVLLGGAAGGALGSTVTKGDGKVAAIIGGTILGMIVGGSVGRYMDDVDQACVGQALEHAGDGQTIHWNQPDRNQRYDVTPTRTYQVSDGRYCREYQTTATVGGRVQETYGRACRQPDGSWQIVQ